MIRDLDASQWANVSGSALVFLASATAAIMYHVRAPWWRSPIGRHIMGVTVSVGLLGLYTVILTFWPGGDLAWILRYIRSGLLVILAVMMIQRTKLIAESQSNHGD